MLPSCQFGLCLITVPYQMSHPAADSSKPAPPDDEPSGYFKSDANGNFTSEFVTSVGTKRSFNGKFSTVVTQFAAKEPIVASAFDQLEGIYYITAGSTVGPTTLSITATDDGDPQHTIMFTGTLWPNIDKAYPLLGVGTWGPGLEGDDTGETRQAS
ncbi:hypothetical protein B0T24DRAFT_675389 [Lasiosphaeria ovina]|uniref:Uncharacterized protein n=1 Tax=Lasiosphaeria ovina TaxID=92902 RepID=A0AAE0TSB5_9PEZI|nr:hypothetical protein B0T24DRAFT_675389 [Lasiosphaeria ovina]